MKKILLRILSIGLILCLICSLAMAESGRGDLTERFSEPTLEYQGATYRIKNRLTTLVFLFVDELAPAEEQIQMLGILAVDDDLKRIVPFFVDGRTQITDESGRAVQLYELYAQGEDGAQRCELLLKGLNALFPHDVLENYMAVEIKGLDLLDGGAQEAIAGENQQAALKQRLKKIKAGAEGSSANDMMDQFSRLSEYIETNMKTGAVAKVADKAERYDVTASQTLPGETVITPDGSAYVQVKDETLLPMIIDAFYEEKIW